MQRSEHKPCHNAPCSSVHHSEAGSLLRADTPAAGDTAAAAAATRYSASMCTQAAPGRWSRSGAPGSCDVLGHAVLCHAGGAARPRQDFCMQQTQVLPQLVRRGDSLALQALQPTSAQPLLAQPTSAQHLARWHSSNLHSTAPSSQNFSLLCSAAIDLITACTAAVQQSSQETATSGTSSLSALTGSTLLDITRRLRSGLCHKPSCLPLWLHAGAELYLLVSRIYRLGHSTSRLQHQATCLPACCWC
jgi:hypothetical protein